MDFDFARYISERRGEVAARAQTGTSYAFSGERKLRRGFVGTRPVAMAIEATNRLWTTKARDELLREARTAAEDAPRVWSAAKKAAAALGAPTPSVYLAPPSFAVGLTTLGTDEQPYIVLRTDVAQGLTDDELVAAMGHELGHIQNGHVVYTTTTHYLTHSAIFFVRWMVQPALVALKAWARRSQVTCDRAALLASKSLDVTLATLVKLELGVDHADVAGYAAAPPQSSGVGRFTEMFRAHPLLPKRITALRLFADGALYAQATGGDAAGKESTDAIDKKVADLLSSF
ncbi:MAG TPA: M48 family metalloprotease [Kofleriaceae bacterium]|nr:M48 family metalloprotease [Kofleriaceae bacterium]